MRGRRSIAPSRTRSALSPGATSRASRPAVRAASIPAAAVARTTSWPASRNAAANGTNGRTCPTIGLATNRTRMGAAWSLAGPPGKGFRRAGGPLLERVLGAGEDAAPDVVGELARRAQQFGAQVGVLLHELRHPPAV